MFRMLRPVLPFLALGPVFVLSSAAAPAASPSPAAAQPALLGFTEERAAAQRDLESRFDAVLRPENLRTWMQQLTAHPHPVGSPWGKKNAEFMAGLFRSWGYDVALEEFQVLFPTPKTRRLELLAPTRFTATLSEPPIAEDSTSSQIDEALPTYNAYSIDGDVTGELVFVNYGVPADYEELARRGVDVRGKIVLARYGGSWRGIKPKVAAEHGAIGCIIYSDPREDGYTQGDPYPKGGYRPERGAQRGSVADMPVHPGDPLTPGVGSTREAKRLPLSEAETLTKVPVLPISWSDALPLLQALGGPTAPDGWRGALPATYHLGPGPARVHLQLAFNWNTVTAYDVIAKLKGSRYPDQWVIRGNHHDGWVHGASDPTSGMVALLEEARAVGELAKSGWRPQRTIVYAGWDGEEPGLLGSVEWAETHAGELRDKAVVYINSDSNARGFLDIGGSHTLEALANEVARDVKDPEKGVSVGERLRAVSILNGSPDPDQLRELRDKETFRIEPLGSGSDFTPFLQHLGISSLNISFGGEEEYGQYHSLYDSFDHFTRFVDPDFSYGVALAKTGGRFVLRIAEADVLPFEIGRFSKTVGRYVDEVVQLADSLREEATERSRRLADRTYELVDDPKSTLVPPKALDPVPYVNLAPLQTAAAALDRSTSAYDDTLEARTASGRPLSAAEAEQLNKILFKAERALTRKEGLPRRPWFQHQIYAPGFYTGYGVKTLAGVREALEQRNWKEAEEQAVALARVLEGYTKVVDQARAVVE
ncbi:MAG TPA: M28 family metallopeptidase [Thermoanaerobaculia bacterium]|nr:M28 family metallopeptidase [Thermoanaerobaculia bacterium]